MVSTFLAQLSARFDPSHYKSREENQQLLLLFTKEEGFVWNCSFSHDSGKGTEKQNSSCQGSQKAERIPLWSLILVGTVVYNYIPREAGGSLEARSS